MRRRSRIFFLTGLLVGLIVFVTAVPLLLPVERVRGSVERLISSYAGESLRLSGAGTVRMLPGMEIEFRDVEARPALGGPPVLTAERVRLSLDLVQYLLGRGVLMSVELVRPEIRLPRPETALAEATRVARLMRMRPAHIAMRQGSVVFVGADGETVGRFDKLDLDYGWPRPSGRLRLAANFDWRGQPVAVSVQGQGPRALAEGETGNLSLTLTAPAGRLAFAGQVSAAERLQLDGALSLSAAQPLALARWLGGAETAGFDLGRTTLDGRLKLAGASATVNGVELKLGDAAAEGILSANWDGVRPLIRGTLDFDTLAVDRDAATAAAPALLSWAVTPALLRAADLDLRLSVEQLKLEALAATHVAATVVVKDGQLSGQIAEARLAGGNASARLTTHPQSTTARLALEVSADRLDLGRLAATFGLAEPRAGSVSGEARIEATASPAAIGEVSGRASLKATELRFGQTPAWLIGEGGGNRPLVFDTGAGEATLAGTTVTVTKLTADGPAAGVTLAGSIDLAKGKFGLAGFRSLTTAEQPRRQAVTPLGLGGSLAAPEARLGGR
jgi:AsmA protein